MGLRDKPRDMDSFRNKNPEDEGADSPPPTEEEELRVAKNTRMKPSLSRLLDKMAHDRKMAGSRKVYEADILEEALVEHFKKHGYLD